MNIFEPLLIAPEYTAFVEAPCIEQHQKFTATFKH